METGYRSKNIGAGMIANVSFCSLLITGIFVFDRNNQLEPLIIYCVIFGGMFLISLIFTIYNIYKKCYESPEDNPLL